MRRFLLGVFVAAGFSLAAGPALAQETSVECDAKIIDTTTARVLDTSQVRAAIARLEEVGADVRVRVFQEAPGGSLDRYQANHVRNCASWQGPEGATKSNLITFFFSMDRKSAIFYGGSYGDELGAVIDGIRDQVMGDQLRAGNYTGGIVASVDAVKKELIPFDWSELWRKLAVLAVVALGVVALILLVWALFGQLGKLRARRERLQQTRQRVFTLRHEAEALYTSIEDGREQLSTAYCEVMDVISSDAKEAFDRDLRALLKKVFDLRRRWDIVTTDEGMTAPRSQADADNCVTVWKDGILELAREIDGGVEALLTRCHELKEEAENAPKELEETLRLLGELRKLQASIETLGYKPVVDSDSLKTEQDRIDTAGWMIERHDYGGAREILSEVRRRFADASKQIHELPERRADLIRRLTQALENAELFPDQLVGASEALGHARATYHQSNWEGLQGLFDYLKDKTGQWHAVRVAAEWALSMDVQDWAKAARLVTELEEVVKEVPQKCAHLIGQVTSLDVLAASARQMLADAAADIQSRSEEFGRYKGDQSSAKRDLSVLETYDLKCLQASLSGAAGDIDYLRFKQGHDQLTVQLTQVAQAAKARHDSVLAEEKRRREEEEAAARRAQQAAADAAAVAAAVTYNPGGGDGGASVGGGSSGSW